METRERGNRRKEDEYIRIMATNTICTRRDCASEKRTRVAARVLARYTPSPFFFPSGDKFLYLILVDDFSGFAVVRKWTEESEKKGGKNAISSRLATGPGMSGSLGGEGVGNILPPRAALIARP